MANNINCAVPVEITAGVILLGGQLAGAEVASGALILCGASIASRTPAAAAPVRPAAHRRVGQPSTRSRSLARPPSLSMEQIGQAPLARVATSARYRAT